MLFASKPAMEVTALVSAWKEIDASQEASVVINGTYAYVHDMRVLSYVIHLTIRSNFVRFLVSKFA